MMRCFVFALACTTLPAFSSFPGTAVADDVKITDDGSKAVVTIDGKPFTEYRYSGYAKPILYPVYGPGQKPMTRNYPMVKGVDNEATDHPHHKSIWYTHDEVNGIRFWMEDGEGKAEKQAGTQVPTKLEIKGNTIVTTNDWKAPDGDTVCSDKRVLTFGTDGDARYIDYEVTWIASSGDVTIGDTKEGTMGIRTHPKLRLNATPKRGNHTAGGHSINSEGVTGKAMWGKRAAWVDYWGEIDGQVTGVAIFDHPDNPRHPTWWHARDYGLVAANPFGVNHFEGKPDGTGDMTLPAGETLTFRYRFLFHPGDAEAADIAKRYKQYAGK
jgi:hypothetical protein